MEVQSAYMQFMFFFFFDIVQRKSVAHDFFGYQSHVIASRLKFIDLSLYYLIET